GTINVVPDHASFTLGLAGASKQEWETLAAGLAVTACELSQPKGWKPHPHAASGENVTIQTSSATPLAEIPSAIRMTVDLRNASEDKIDAADAAIEQRFTELAAQGLHLHSARKQRIAPTPGNPFLINLVRGVKQTLGYTDLLDVVLAAGHDFNNFAYALWHGHRIPAVMIASACVKGISHNVEERTLLEDIHQSGNVLLHTMLQLADARTVIPEWNDPPPLNHAQKLEMEFGAPLSRA
ncbi:MAG: M20/M25/M40 family metallo-hydrolase, partial [Alphaproteobacteria bacterium]|nr:M20/M25/M40 family metallo-hydrolase [Alphaproteobacteria bacterium]